MKQVLLLTIAVFISILGISQNSLNNSPDLDNSFFEDKQSSPELKIYPNPCKSNIVTIDFNSHQITDIQLTNITGKLVYNKKLQFYENKIQLQLNNIQNGIYLLKVKSADNKVVVKKFVVSTE